MYIYVYIYIYTCVCVSMCVCVCVCVCISICGRHLLLACYYAVLIIGIGFFLAFKRLHLDQAISLRIGIWGTV